MHKVSHCKYGLLEQPYRILPLDMPLSNVGPQTGPLHQTAINTQCDDEAIPNERASGQSKSSFAVCALEGAGTWGGRGMRVRLQEGRM